VTGVMKTGLVILLAALALGAGVETVAR